MPYLIVDNKKVNNKAPAIGWYGNSEDADSVDSSLIQSVSESDERILDYCPDYESFHIHFEWWLRKAEYSHGKPMVARFLGLFRS